MPTEVNRTIGGWISRVGSMCEDAIHVPQSAAPGLRFTGLAETILNANDRGDSEATMADPPYLWCLYTLPPERA